MAEGLSPAEVGKEIAEHRERSHAAGAHTGRDRVVTIIEAALLATVALLAAWSGYASAKWSTEVRLLLGEASTARSEANRASGLDAETRSFDSSTFDAWFTAYVANNQEAMDVAEHRFRPEFQVAFDAWMETDPFTNEDAPPGPTYMPEYKLADQAKADALDREAETASAVGNRAAVVGDEYVRITVFLAAVLFLVGIGSTFKLHTIRYSLITIGSLLLLLATVLILQQPGLPS